MANQNYSTDLSSPADMAVLADLFLHTFVDTLCGGVRLESQSIDAVVLAKARFVDAVRIARVAENKPARHLVLVK